ncbi:MAG: hypothetical protein K2F66_02270 [Duncaniella sp.]|nr:hypothetical protein [Duncaniella sp.]
MIANKYAAAMRVDNTSVPGLRMSLSGYIGDSFRNTLYSTDGKKVENIHGTVAIGSFDFAYRGHNIVARGHFDYGHLSDAKAITDFNMSMSKNSISKRQRVGSATIATGIEAGYNVLGLVTGIGIRKRHGHS